MLNAILHVKVIQVLRRTTAIHNWGGSAISRPYHFTLISVVVVKDGRMFCILIALFHIRLRKLIAWNESSSVLVD